MKTSHAATTHKFLIALVSMLMILTACGSPEKTTTSASELSLQSFTVSTFIKHKHGTTKIDGEISRIVTIGYNDHDTLLALGIAPVGILEWYGDWSGGLWPWSSDQLKKIGGERPEVIGTAQDAAPNYEKIAALAPDLIIGTYSGLSKDQYAKLAKIAPTVAQPGEYADWGIPWDKQVETIGQAVGKTDEAAQLVKDTTKLIKDAAKAHPELQGKTFAVGALDGPGRFGIYGEEDPKTRLVSQLGLVTPDTIKEKLTGKNYAPISTENLGEVDLDVMIWYASEDFAPKLAYELEASDVYNNLDVVKENRVVTLSDDAAQAWVFSDVLSIPFALKSLPRTIADTAAGK